MNFLELKKYSFELNRLDNSLVSNLCSLIFSQRENDLSVCTVTRDKDVYRQICGNTVLPRNFLDGNYIKWGIDLESIGANKVRIYRVPPKSSKTRIEGFYVDSNGNVIERKVYNSKSSRELIIDRYDARNNIISSGELEVETIEDNWTGPREIVKDVKTGRYEFNFMRKVAKNQTYLIVHNQRRGK
jgi:hypothetical protein